MNKEVLVRAIYDVLPKDTNLRKQDVAVVIDALGPAVQSLLKSGSEMVVVPGLGRIKKVFTEIRHARNPRTGEAIVVDAHYKVKFAPSGELKTAVRE